MAVAQAQMPHTTTASTSAAVTVVSLAYIRAVACVLVVVTHLSGAYFTYPSDNWAASNFYGSLSRVCVPMFFMLTGALFLKREEPVGYYYSKRLLRIALPLVIWSMFWLAWLSQSGSAPENWLLAIVKGPVIFHLWYFYMLFSMSLVMPVFVKFYSRSTAREVWSVIGVWYLFCSVLPVVDTGHHVYGIEASGVTSVIGYSGFFLLGAALSDMKLGRKKAAGLGAAMFVVGSAVTMLLTQRLSEHAGRSADFYHYYTSPAVVLASVGIFLAMLQLGRAPTLVHKMLMLTASCSLGVYCLHILTLDRLRAYGGMIGGPENAWIMVPVNALVILLITIPIIYCIRLIKPLRSFA